MNKAAQSHAPAPPRSRKVLAAAFAGTFAAGYSVALAIGFSLSEAVHMAVPPAFLAYMILSFHEMKTLDKVLAVARIPLFPIAVYFFGSMLASRINGWVSPCEVIICTFFLWSLVIILFAARRAVIILVRTFIVRVLGRKDQPGRVWDLAATLIFLILFMPYLFLFMQVHRIKIESSITPKTYANMAYEDVYFTSTDGAARIHGFFIPRANSQNTVVILHGIGANKSNFMPFAEFPYLAGWNTLLFDFRAHGECPGHTSTFGVTEKHDVAAAVEFVRKRFPSGKVVLLSVSMGTSAAMHALAHGVQVDGVVLDSPLYSFKGAISRRFGSLAANYIYFGMTPFALVEAGVWLPSASPYTLKGDFYETPALVVKNGMDFILPPEDADRIYERFRGPKFLVEAEDATHGQAIFEAPEEYEAALTNFLEITVMQGADQPE